MSKAKTLIAIVAFVVFLTKDKKELNLVSSLLNLKSSFALFFGFTLLYSTVSCNARVKKLSEG